MTLPLQFSFIFLVVNILTILVDEKFIFVVDESKRLGLGSEARDKETAGKKMHNSEGTYQFIR